MSKHIKQHNCFQHWQ